MTLYKAPSDITPAPALRVVVGYDGSAGSQAALERAVDVAGDDGVVFVVHAYALPHNWLGHPNYQERLDAALDDAESTIRDLRERTGGPLDRVAWESEIIGGDPPRPLRPWPPPATRTRSSSAVAGSAWRVCCSAASRAT